MGDLYCGANPVGRMDPGGHFAPFDWFRKLPLIAQAVIAVVAPVVIAYVLYCIWNSIRGSWNKMDQAVKHSDDYYNNPLDGNDENLENRYRGTGRDAVNVGTDVSKRGLKFLYGNPARGAV